MHLKKIILAAVAGLFTINGIAQTIPVDPAVRTGKLSNGFTYYIRHNEYPKNRVELYLVNKVGSVLEDDDQQGLAHFMEHMNFNGTKNYPKNDMVDYLQKAGVRFGADLNAYTSFDETVYELPLPTDDPTMFSNGIKIMRDWAQDATLDSIEIEKERGVVLEEERLGKGAKDRMSRQYFPMLLNHARYADRIPIGKDAILTTFKPAIIKRFHNDWYRPDLQALIVVGDIDVDQAEKMIREKFADLKNPTAERTRTKYSIPLTGKSQFMIVTDKEAQATSLDIMMKHTATRMQTQEDYIAQIKESLFNELIATRKNTELSQLQNPAFTEVSIGINGLLNNVDMLSFSVTAKEGKLEESFDQSWKILEQVKRYGFTQGEFDRAKANFLRGLETGVKEKDKTSSASYVKEYQNLFLHEEASPGIDWEYQFTKEHLYGITLQNLSQFINGYLQSKDIDILVSAPEKDKSELPDSATVQSWINNLHNQPIAEFKDQVINKSLLTVEPRPGKIIKKETFPAIGVTKLVFSNGVTVFLKPTTFKNDQILYTAYRPGGTSLYDHTDFDIASNAAGLISSFGVGSFNPVQLSAIMTGKIVHSQVSIGPRTETVNGSTTPEDLESALQLTYLQFTKPRTDTLLFKNTMSNAIASLANRYADPMKAFADTMSYVTGDYNYRSAPPTVERLQSITLPRAAQIYKERFGDASGFTFVFVGNFTTDGITPLLEKYLGALPSTRKVYKARDLGIHIPAGHVVAKVYKGAEDKAIIRIVYSGDYQYSPAANLELRALSDILQIKVLQHLRENESEVYSPQVQAGYNKYPRNRFAINITFGCAPQNADHLVTMVVQELKNLKEKGPEPDDIEKFKAQYQKSVDVTLKENSFWVGYLSSQSENNDNLLDVLNIQQELNKINKDSLKQAAATFLTGQNMITFELLPEKLNN